MFLQLFLEYSRKKNRNVLFSKNFVKIGGWFFFRLFEHKFANFSKTAQYIRNFFIDGWDGWSVHFFFGPYLENYFIIFLNCFSSLKYMFLHIFWNILRKKSEYSFFQNISPKSSTTFFSKIFSRISQFLENYSIYLPHCFWSP